MSSAKNVAWRKRHDRECIRDLVINTIVWRVCPERHDIERGIVQRVSLGQFNLKGDIEELVDQLTLPSITVPLGAETHRCYVAMFKTPRGPEYEIQTYQDRFFYDVRDAHRALEQKINKEIIGLYTKIERLKSKAAAHSKLAGRRKLPFR